MVRHAPAARHPVHRRLAELAAEEARRRAHVRLDRAEVGGVDAAVAARRALLVGLPPGPLFGQLHPFDQVGGVGDARLGGHGFDEGLRGSYREP